LIPLNPSVFTDPFFENFRRNPEIFRDSGSTEHNITDGPKKMKERERKMKMKMK